MEEMERLQYISLVSKICTELENHLGLSDKDLAEFIIHLGQKNPTFESFKSALESNGAEFDNSLISNLLRRIQLMTKPTGKSEDAAENASHMLSMSSKSDREVMKQCLPALAMPNKPVSETLSELENLIPQWRRENEIEQKANTGHGSRDERKKRERLHSRDRSSSCDSSERRAERRRARRRRSSRRSRSGERISRIRIKLDDTPTVGKIYDGRVNSLRDFGCFVELFGLRRHVEGLVHISQIKDERVNAVSDVVTRGQKVKVKVLASSGNRTSLSMREVDQETGEDLNPTEDVDQDDQHFDETLQLRNPDLPSAAQQKLMQLQAEEFKASTSKRTKRLSSPERWELKQMMAASCISTADLPDFDEETGVLLQEDMLDDHEEDVEVELVEEEPQFLQGYGRVRQDLEPIKVVKNPDGSLAQAAMMQGALAKERREQKIQQQRERGNEQQLGRGSGSGGRSFLDPLADGDSKYSKVLQNVERKHMDLPEWKRHIAAGKSFGKPQGSMTILEQRQSLPIYKLRSELVKAVSENQILIVIGETGSGKTTQITQYLAEEGFTFSGKIACTQPRRVAAMSVAKRVAEEYGCRLGQQVGYTIRFEDCTSPDTNIKYMTDGMLLRECLLDPDLNAYSVIMLDEAHERTIHTDVLFGLCKQAVKNRGADQLKLIVTSATLDAVKFSQYFNEAPIFTIPGRTFPVEVLYTREPETDYLDASLITVMQIHLTEPPGDILVFLTGQEEIDTACEVLYERMKSLGPDVPELIILPVYSALPSEMQTRIFESAPPGSRKVVIATNIAETSLTIDGIYYVVDPGFVKQKIYNPKTGMDSLVVTPISQAQAKQRSGRAGRTGPGKCYRLYTERAYRDEMLPTPVPEIQRTNLASTLLQLKAMGINNLIDFDFMDPPPVEAMVMALEQLHSLSALDDEGLLTRVGRRMAEFPLEPSLAKLLIMSVHLGCSEEVLTIVSMISVQNVFYRPKDKQDVADQKKSKFHQPEGDHLTLLAVYNSWKNHRYSHSWCYENFVQIRTLKRAQDIRKQLLGIMDRHRLDMISCGKNMQKVQKAICSGFFRNAAKKDPQEGYRTLVDSQTVYIHPSSSLFHNQPEWVVYHELVMTTKEYMREVCAIEPKWLVEFAPAFFRFGDPTKLSKFKKGQKIEPLFNKYEDVNAWRISKVKKKIYNPNR
ncbi:putative pre-mRNA-splicing factor ATP-dependent RNA helicase mog-5 [Trichinella britovi]|uniref:RNA helicase n=2 Tax=Trichinella TaxID=6333 RepID=A0A0V1D240_TRIBR|nr:putative pre-mRNA-splicing factor ATP-dependent RNA helicase mog-5 [Trichinella murrelli]KRY55612.1 putative pre-mRNA-splicing factor ATP-dependent RNA helicase mog-5 [Trichinella britovi]